jgi:sterol desaturase/sphingolipid hydroxylase (fatty acid hydroxylase superfamily)
MMEKIFELFREGGLVMATAPVCVILILVEMYLSNRIERPAYTLKDTFTNVYLTLCQMLVDVITRRIPTYLALMWVLKHQVYHIENKVWYWIWLFIIQDFCFYWIHRLEHSSRFFWAVHVTHHSSEHFNLSTGFRSSVLEPIYRFVFFLPIPLLGFDAKDLFLVFSITQIYGIGVHTELIKKVWGLEWLFVTPSHHRVHHASNVRYLDKNIGMLLIIWDKIFGTFEPERDDEPIQYGLTSPTDRDGWLKVIFHEFIAIYEDAFVKHRSQPWKVRWMYIFGPPGWSHDGSTLTSKQLQAKMSKPESSPVEKKKSIQYAEELV